MYGGVQMYFHRSTIKLVRSLVRKLKNKNIQDVIEYALSKLLILDIILVVSIMSKLYVVCLYICLLIYFLSK